MEEARKLKAQKRKDYYEVGHWTRGGAMFTFQRRKAERAQDKAAREDSGGDHDQGRGESSKKPPVRVLLTDLPALVDVYQLTVPGQDDLRPQG